MAEQVQRILSRTRKEGLSFRTGVSENNYWLEITRWCRSGRDTSDWMEDGRIDLWATDPISTLIAKLKDLRAKGRACPDEQEDSDGD